METWGGRGRFIDGIEKRRYRLGGIFSASWDIRLDFCGEQ